MLAGEAVVAIWNGIAPEARAQYYDWHIVEHMPERVGIPGFRRGRRFVAVDSATQPEFFTLYEADTIEVLKGVDYANRLNDPTPGTRATVAKFSDITRALARVVESRGPGMGGVMLTIRFNTDDTHLAAFRALVRAAAHAERISGAHLCRTDETASGVLTKESRDRGDKMPPPWFAMVEATDAEALTNILLDQALIGAGATGATLRGVYRLEYVRIKTAFAP